MTGGGAGVFEWDEEVFDAGDIDEDVLCCAGLLDCCIGLYVGARSLSETPLYCPSSVYPRIKYIWISLQFAQASRPYTPPHLHSEQKTHNQITQLQLSHITALCHLLHHPISPLCTGPPRYFFTQRHKHPQHRRFTHQKRRWLIKDRFNPLRRWRSIPPLARITRHAVPDQFMPRHGQRRRHGRCTLIRKYTPRAGIR